MKHVDVHANPDVAKSSQHLHFVRFGGRSSTSGRLPEAGPTQVTRRADFAKIVGSKSNTGTGAIDRQQDQRNWWRL